MRSSRGVPKSGRRARGCFVAVSSVVIVLLLLVRSWPVEGGGGEASDLVIGQSTAMAMVGDARDVKVGAENSVEIEQLGRFAVDEHNKKENTLLEFSRVVKAKEQVVSGVLYNLTVEVVEGGKKKLYEAKVWVQAWLNSRQLTEFKHVGDSPSE